MSDSVKEVTVDSVESLHKTIRKQWGIVAVYRGEAQVSYELRPKIGRIRLANPSWNTIVRERRMLEDFKKRAVRRLFASGQQITGNGWRLRNTTDCRRGF